MTKVGFAFALFTTTISIYSISFVDIDGSELNFSGYQGKKILIVNTASNSPYTNQYASLEQLYQQYKDSLMVVAFPSNSFGNESGNNAAIKNFVLNTYNIHFLLGAKVEVTGSGQAPIFQWLTQESRNGMMNNTIQSDFQKFLIEKDGTLIGVFSADVSPLDSSIHHAIIGK